MQRIDATLPTLGSVPIDFHAESEDVLQFIGGRELERLGDVPHLGVASTVFTGVSHSRLEYVLLQCAMIGLTGKLHRNNESVAISSEVTLNGISGTISSGEELLKCWTLLSNYGHAQYTYGVERSLLQAARRDKKIGKWLTTPSRFADIRGWCRSVVSEYRDEHAHFLLALARIDLARPRDRRKTRCVHYLRNLLLPSGDLFPGDYTKQVKLERLRRLFARVRLLSMTTLDSYYSHHPFRLQLNSVVLSLAELTAAGGERSGFDRVIEETAGWLADELYLHARAATVQREYEVRVERDLPLRYAKALKKSRGLVAFVNNVMWNGFGRPSSDSFVHLVRLSFSPGRRPLLGRHDLFDTLQQLQGELTQPPSTYLTIDKNRFSGVFHLDMLYAAKLATSKDVAAVYSKTYRWLIRSLEAQALSRFRDLLQVGQRTPAAQQALLRRNIEMVLRTDRTVLESLFRSVIRYVLADDRFGTINDMMPGDPVAKPVWIRLRASNNEVFDQVGPELVRQIEDNPRNYPPDRLQELKAVRRVIQRSTAPLVLACIEKFVVRDRFGKAKHEWDGVLVEIGDDGVRLRIVEAKNTGSRRVNENEAMAQLRLSAAALCQRRGLTYRRTRLAGLGAVLSCTMSNS